MHPRQERRNPRPGKRLRTGRLRSQRGFPERCRGPWRILADLLRRGGRILRGSGVAFAGFVESITGRHAAWDAVTRGGGPIVTFWHVNSVAGHLGVARKFLELPRLLPALYSGIPFA